MKKCRICENGLSSAYLDLGRSPLANSYVSTDTGERGEPTYELAVAFCDNCHLSQLTIVVPPELMFDHYLYVSSTTHTFRKHCEELAASALTRLDSFRPQDFVLDIASNDGCLLATFQAKGFRILGVDPAMNIVAEARARGIDTIRGYWSQAVAAEVLKRAGKAKVVTATNVLGHVDRIHDFLSNVVSVLDDNGLFVFEVPYLVDLIESVEFDTIYHEHLSYFLVGPLQMVLQSNHLRIIDLERRPIHGGSIRVYAVKDSRTLASSSHVQDAIDSESAKGFYDLAVYRHFAEFVRSNRAHTLAMLNAFKSENKQIAGYGASAKGNTLLNYYGLNSSIIDYIVDDNPKKHGFLTPGSRIPIMPPATLASTAPDYLLLLAWNFAEEIRSRTTAYRQRGGKYIVPVPRCVCES